MLVDINANIGHWPFKRFQYTTCDALLQRMTKFGVDVSAIANINGIFYKNTQSANEELHEEINSNRRFKNRFMPFAVINPAYAGWKYDLDECINKFGVKGIRLYPKYHDYEITDPSSIELIKTARDRGLPVAYTLRMVDTRLRSWMDVTEEWSIKDIIPVIKEVPDAKYMILNIANKGELNDDEFNLMRNSNVLLDTSGRAVARMGEYIKEFGKEKLAFGTHSPILDSLTGLIRIESLEENEADEDTKELLRSVNAIRFLNLQ